jgi:hypothetical protein
MTITRNAVKCNNCETAIESTHVHDFVMCMCEDEDLQVFVDGGHAYSRMVFGKKASWTDLSETTDDEETIGGSCE